MSDYQIADTYPIWGIKRGLYREYIREWAAQQGIGLKEAA